VPLWPVRDSPKSVRVGAPKGRPGEVGEASGPFVAKGRSGEAPLPIGGQSPTLCPQSVSRGRWGGEVSQSVGVGVSTEGEAGKLRGRGGQSVGGGRGMGAPKGVWLARATSHRHPLHAKNPRPLP